MEALNYFTWCVGEADETQQHIRSLLENEVLQPLNGTANGFPEGTIFVPCSDGHRFGDVYTHHRERCFNGSDMQMPLALPGGAMIIADDAALEDAYPYMTQNMLKFIGLSAKAKACPNVVLYTHAPCAMAHIFDLGIQEVLILHAKAEANVREYLTNNGHECTTIISCFHIDFLKLAGDEHFPGYPDNKRFRTYRFHPARL